MSNLSFVCHLLAIQVCRLVLASSYVFNVWHLILSFLICRLVSSCAIFLSNLGLVEGWPQKMKNMQLPGHFLSFLLRCFVMSVMFVCHFFVVLSSSFRLRIGLSAKSGNRKNGTLQNGNDEKWQSHTKPNDRVMTQKHILDNPDILLAKFSWRKSCGLWPILPYNRYKQMTFRWHQDSIYSKNDGPKCVSPEGMCNPSTDVCNPSDSMRWFVFARFMENSSLVKLRLAKKEALPKVYPRFTGHNFCHVSLSEPSGCETCET